MAVRTSPVPGDGKYEPIVIDSDEDEGVMGLAREGETVVGPAGGAAEVREVCVVPWLLFYDNLLLIYTHYCFLTAR